MRVEEKEGKAKDKKFGQLMVIHSGSAAIPDSDRPILQDPGEGFEKEPFSKYVTSKGKAGQKKRNALKNQEKQ